MTFANEKHDAPGPRVLSGTEISVPSGTWTDINEDGDADPGEIIVYNLDISNAGTVSLFNMTVFSDTIGAESIECPVLPEGGLDPGAKVACAATYKVRTKIY